MGYQFARLELYSRKGKAGRGTDFIFDEVSREPAASLHVQNPKPPEVVFGRSIEDLRAIHDQGAAAAKVIVSGKPKAIRKDQNTLGTVIISHPATVEEVQADPAIQRDVLDWERRSIDWLKSRYGGELMTVVRHVDESHPHLHAYLVPNDGEMRAGKFHPGFSAKNAVKAAGPRDGEDDKALAKRADKAYVEAMRKLLDDFHERVAIPSGLTRLGPQKRRLTRAEWQQEKTQAKALKKTIERAKRVKTDGEKFINRTKADAAKIAADAACEQEAARKATAAALAAQDRARQDQEKARASMADAEKYGGWAGRIRAIWDGFRKSKLVEQIRFDLSGEIERWRDKARDAERRQLEAERQRHEAERKVRDAQDAAFRAGVERDRLRSMLSPADDQFAPERSPAPKLELKPKWKKEKRDA